MPEERVSVGEGIAVAKGVPVMPDLVLPAYICEACGSLYSDKDGNEVIHVDTNEGHKTCECLNLVSIDARSIRTDAAGNIVGAVRL